MTIEKIILASGSKHKKKLFKECLDNLGADIVFDIMSSSLGDEDERAIVDDMLRGVDNISLDLADEITSTLALAKAQDVFKKLGSPRDTLVVGADSTILFDDRILDKYKSVAEARETLNDLCNTHHHILTGMAFVSAENETAYTETINVNPKGASADYVDGWLEEVGEDMVLSVCGYAVARGGLQQVLDLEDSDINTIIGLSTDMIKNYLASIEVI